MSITASQNKTSEIIFTILGCASSQGVPRIGGDWGKCDPANPKNRRTRCSMLVERTSENGTTRVLIDAGPDLREQLLRHNVQHLDAVLFTHPHADHCHGLDDLRAFWIMSRERVETYMDAPTAVRLHEAFDYCYKTPEGSSYPPILNDNRIAAYKPFSIHGAGGAIEFMPFEQEHGDIKSLGFRVGNLAYSSDVSGLDDKAISHLQGLDIWIVDALRIEPHVSHFSMSEAVEWVTRIGAKQGILTHMHADLDYEATNAVTPDNIEAAYDGMVLTISV